VLRKLSILFFGLYLLAITGMIGLPALHLGGEGNNTSRTSRISFNSFLHNPSHSDEDAHGSQHRDMQLPVKVLRTVSMQQSTIDSYGLFAIVPFSAQFDLGHQQRNSNWHILSSYHNAVWQPPRA